MTYGLAFGRRVYDWWSRHAMLYRVLTLVVLLGRESSLRRRAVRAIGLGAGDSVLDLACGHGANFALLEDGIGPEGRLVAFDYSTGMLDSARCRATSRGWANIEFVHGDAARMDLPAESLDGALCSLGLSAMPDPEAAIRNVHAALRTGARLVVLDAGQFDGPGRVLNPLIRLLFRRTTNWNYEADIIAAAGDVFGRAEVEKFNGGSIYIAAAAKRAPDGSA